MFPKIIFVAFFVFFFSFVAPPMPLDFYLADLVRQAELVHREQGRPVGPAKPEKLIRKGLDLSQKKRLNETMNNLKNPRFKNFKIFSFEHFKNAILAAFLADTYCFC